ncbi:hypothetical protein AN958_07817 [Leucoagaricus sp. SymC.cos]|nr:hypothetical protein AN958_07817 [Leucoagaricus sp. SymC.cos]
MSDLSLWTQARVACGICTGLAVVATAARVHIRIRNNRFWLDDVGLSFILLDIQTFISAMQTE